MHVFLVYIKICLDRQPCHSMTPIVSCHYSLVLIPFDILTIIVDTVSYMNLDSSSTGYMLVN